MEISETTVGALALEALIENTSMGTSQLVGTEGGEGDVFLLLSLIAQ